MTEISFNVYYTIALAVLALMLGDFIKKRIYVLRKFCIPTPVVGGVLVALLITALNLSGTASVSLDSSFNEFFSLLFYAGIGYTASWKLLKKGGPQVILFLVLSSILVVFQNGLGIVICHIMGINPLIGMACGSIPMVGGNGTAAAWGPILESAGLDAGTTIATAAATFGLVAGALLGGPIGRFLIEKKHLKPGLETKEMKFGDKEEEAEIDEKRMTAAAYQILLTVGLGTLISYLLELTGLEFPASVGAMTAAAILRNIADHSDKLDLKLPELSIISNISLLVFLALSMMTMELWKLIDLAVPMFLILLAQMILITLYGIFVNFRFMGRNFDAAVMTVGMTGFGLGAVPTAMANMQVIESKYGSSPSAFFIVPLVGSLFINLVNSAIITGFLNFL
ncbi:sodium/glutamate symporter [Clostridium sp. M62/1]|uniref:sodium/glutamate symporter n=1 Tax=Clostridium sp. M62/1 TaxID=411486 RepID=UPI0001973B3C|nr:sodium/glutamate symporter [Clostridium sp. M62/1]EFE13728.1 sodium/glutamate symporter [Clostridium sp. M62/1]UEB80170.1 sodium/glutamate symporter [Clostridium sp. M62/1]CBK78322.1 sodium--glutamate symport carrier (gltS) [[Clostridium] cf. saccharolyticum K10]CCY84200.1 sodium--glutamate symport carrier (GltS) [Clostridium sp. CAG:149]